MSDHDGGPSLPMQQAAAILQGKKKFFIGRAGKYDEQAAQQELEALISQNGVVTFGWTFCPFARRAKELLAELGADFKAVELNELPQGPALRAELIKVCLRTQVVPCAINLVPRLTNFELEVALAEDQPHISAQCFHQWCFIWGPQ